MAASTSGLVAGNSESCPHRCDVPSHEIDILCNTVARALELARGGYHAHGYWELIYGRDRTRLDLEEAWGPELLARWEHAVRAYVREWSPRN